MLTCVCQAPFPDSFESEELTLALGKSICHSLQRQGTSSCLLGTFLPPLTSLPQVNNNLTATTPFSTLQQLRPNSMHIISILLLTPSHPFILNFDTFRNLHTLPVLSASFLFNFSTAHSRAGLPPQSRLHSTSLGYQSISQQEGESYIWVDRRSIASPFVHLQLPNSNLEIHLSCFWMHSLHSTHCSSDQFIHFPCSAS